MMTEYRDRLVRPKDLNEATESISRVLTESSVPFAGARLSTITTNGPSAGVVAAKLVFAESALAARDTHAYPSFTLRDYWFTCDDALVFLRELGTGARP